MRIQAFLTAAAVNLKRLVASLCLALARILSIVGDRTLPKVSMNPNNRELPAIHRAEFALAA